jgi:hypothetical protein
MEKMNERDITLIASGRSMLDSYRYELEYLKDINRLLGTFEVKCCNLHEFHMSLIHTRKRIRRVGELSALNVAFDDKSKAGELSKINKKIQNKKEKIECLINEIQQRIDQTKDMLGENKPVPEESSGLLKIISGVFARWTATMRKTYMDIFQVGFLND